MNTDFCCNKQRTKMVGSYSKELPQRMKITPNEEGQNVLMSDDIFGINILISVSVWKKYMDRIIKSVLSKRLFWRALIWMYTFGSTYTSTTIETTITSICFIVKGLWSQYFKSSDLNQQKENLSSNYNKQSYFMTNFQFCNSVPK